MKLTNQEIINLLNTLNTIAEKDFPISLTYKIIDNQEKLLSQYQVYEKAKAKVKSDEELMELLEVKCDVGISTIDKNELIESGVSLSPVQLVGLKRLINGW